MTLVVMNKKSSVFFAPNKKMIGNQLLYREEKNILEVMKISSKKMMQ
jgi:hypothetical protein